MDPPYWQTEGYGAPFPWVEYEAMASSLRSMKGKAMVSINDHPDIRRVFDGLVIHDLEIKYSVGNNNGSPDASKELVITNFEPGIMGGLF
jgi:DNA adenine methylase